jgi:hypothetical protein
MKSHTCRPDNQPQAGGKAMKIGTGREKKWLLVIVLAIFVLNAMDGLLTVFWVLNYHAVEANPFMQDTVHNHPVLFIIVKMSLVLLGSILLWLLRNRPLAVIGLFAVFLVYYFVVIYHMREFDVPLIMEWLKTPPSAPHPDSIPVQH